MSELAQGDCGACITDYSDGDRPEFHTERWPRARKEHTCCECGEPIRVGERYHAGVGCWNGSVTTYRTCAACHDVRASLCCDGWTYGTLWSDAEESGLFEHLTTGCLTQLATAAGKAKLLAVWRAWKFERS